MNGITRPRLHAIFQEAVKASGADVRLGATVDAGCARTGASPSPTASAGRTTSSSARTASTPGSASLVFPGAPQPEYTGQIVWRYNVPRPEGLDTLDMFVGSNGKAGFVPLAPELMYMLYIEAVPADEVKMPDDRLAEIFRERLAEFGGPVARCGTPTSPTPSMVVVRPGRVAARASAVAPRPGRADRRRRARDLAARRAGRRDGDRGRDRARRGGHR